MNYPDKIYGDFEIVQKEICGETFYGCRQHFRLFGKRIFSIQKSISVPLFTDYGYFDQGYNSRKWLSSKKHVKNAIKDYQSEQEYKFKRKVTR